MFWGSGCLIPISQHVIYGLSPLVNIDIQTRTILEGKGKEVLRCPINISHAINYPIFFNVLLPREANERINGQQ